MEAREERSLPETPTWAVATVLSLLISFGFLFHVSLKHFGQWLDRTKRKALLAAFEKIKDELMLFGLLSLMMGHWTIFVAKICVKSSGLSRRFYPCPSQKRIHEKQFNAANSNYSNYSVSRALFSEMKPEFCPEGRESFASYESLEQLHRFLFVLGMTHVFYSFIAIALAVFKLYSWRVWENQARALSYQGLEVFNPDSGEATSSEMNTSQLAPFLFHQTSHPWTQHSLLLWLLCFLRQFWTSINQDDYMALRFGFLTTHQLPLSYDFHKYMLRSMDEEFRDIVGISVPLWIFGILCVLLGFHGTNIYFWLSFLPAILILLIGTKLHHVVVRLAVEILDRKCWTGQFNLRDELFWFRKPRFLLQLIQFVSFQNAFEMATFLWSLWEIRGPCFQESHSYLWVRLMFGFVSQIWCSFITFPLYVIVTQMGSSFRKTIVSENVRQSLHGWQRRVRCRRDGHPVAPQSERPIASLKFLLDEEDRTNTIPANNLEKNNEDNLISDQHESLDKVQSSEISPSDEEFRIPPC